RNPVVTLTGICFTDYLPEGLAISSPNGLVGSWAEGQLEASPEGDRIALSGATLAPGTSAVFQLKVTGITPGIKTNFVQGVTSSEAGTGNSATASVTVLGDRLNPSSGVDTKIGPNWLTTATISQFSRRALKIVYRADEIRKERGLAQIQTGD